MLAHYSDTWWLPGGKLAACTLVKVYPVDSNIPANLYAGACGSQRLPNPLRTSDRGELSFWAEEGKYWLHIDGRTFPLTVGDSGCIAQGDLDQALGEHVQAGDPHGDRAAANAALMHHQATKKGVHGIVDTSQLETKDGAQCKAQDALETALTMTEQKVDQHAQQTRGVHGICDTSRLETIDGAQCKANEAIAASTLIINERVEEHSARTTDVHGIEDTSKLVTTCNVEPIVAAAAAPVVREIAGPIAEKAAKPVAEEAARAAVDEHAARTTDVHGIPDTSKLATLDRIKPIVEETAGPVAEKAAKPVAEEAARAAVDEHAARTTDVHGIPDTSKLATGDSVKDAIDKALAGLEPGGEWETPEGAQEKADAAQAGAVKAAAEDAQAKADAAREAAEKSARECCAATAEAAQKALDEAIEGLEPGGDPEPGGEWETPEGAQAKADAARDEAIAAAQKCCEATALAADAALKKHVATCHKLKALHEGVNVEDGWKIDMVELQSIGGVNTAFVRLERTGDHIYSTGPDFESEGIPNQGNVVPDMLIANVDKPWCPPKSYLVSAHTSYSTGSVRIHPDGRVYLLDVTYNSPIRTGHRMRFEYEFLTESPCEAQAEDTPDEPQTEPGPGSGVIDPAELADALKAYPSVYGQAKGPDKQVQVTLRVPPSRKVRVATGLRASNGTSKLGQIQQAVRVTKGDQVIVEGGAFPVLELSYTKLNETDAGSRAFHLDFAQVADGAVEAGDEVTFITENRVTVGQVKALDRDLSVESLLA